MHLGYKLGLAAAVTLGIQLCTPPVLSTAREPRIRGLAFRYSPGDSDASHARVRTIDMPTIGALHVDPYEVVFVAEDGMKVGDTSHIFGFVGREQVGTEMRVSSAGAGLSRVQGGPRNWEWLYRPSAAGRVGLHCQFVGPAGLPAPTFDVDTKVLTRFGLSSEHEAIFEIAAAVLSALAGLATIWGAISRRKQVRSI
jgi:hypothetical protein